MKIFKLILVLAVIIIFTSAFSTDYFIPPRDVVRVVIDGDYKNFENPPVIKNGRTLLPIRDVLVALGAPNDDTHIKWNPQEKSVTVNYNNTKIRLVIDDNTAYINGNEMQLDQPATIINNRTYLPTRFVSEALDKAVRWDDEYYAVNINSNTEYNEIKEIWTKVAQSYNDIKNFTLSMSYQINTSFELKDALKEEMKKLNEEQEKKYLDLYETLYPKNIIGNALIKGDISKNTNYMTYSHNDKVSECYETDDFLYDNSGSDTWIKVKYLENEISDLESNSINMGTIDRSAKTSLNKIYNLLNNVSYAGFVKSKESSDNGTILIEGAVLPKNIVSTLINIYPPSFQEIRKMAQNKEKANISEMSYKTKIFINSKNYRIEKIVLYPKFVVNIKENADKNHPLKTFNMLGQISYTFDNYNSEMNIKVPVIGMDGKIMENIITGRDPEKDNDLVLKAKDFNEIVKIIGPWSKMETAKGGICIWNLGEGKTVNIEFDNETAISKVTGINMKGLDSKDLEEIKSSKYEKIDTDMSKSMVLELLGKPDISKDIDFVTYKWNYLHNGKTSILVVGIRDGVIFTRGLTMVET